jgi:hypothetical protein
MTCTRNQSALSLEDVVGTLVDQLNPSTISTLVDTKEEELCEIQSFFVGQLCDYWELEERDLLELCAAQDFDAAAAKLMRAAWTEARMRRLQ